MTASPSLIVSRSQRNASVRFGNGDQAAFLAGVPMPGDERLAIGVGHDERRDRRRPPLPSTARG